MAACDSVPVVLTTRTGSGPVQAEESYPHAWDDLLAAGIALEKRLDGPQGTDTAVAEPRAATRLHPV